MKNDVKPEEITIVIAEDHKLIRSGYVKLLNEKENIRVIGEANNGKELLQLLPSISPTIIMLDMEMPVLSGKEVYEDLRRLYPEIKILIVSAFYNDSFVSEYFLKGVNGYLSKSCEPEELIEAIETIYIEGYYLSKDISKMLVSGIIKSKDYQKKLEEVSLTETELKILKLLCEEKTSKNIAIELNLTSYVVDHHRRSIQAKTQQSSILGLFKFALRNGITNID